MIYISGRISGNKNWKKDFELGEEQAVEELKKLGYEERTVVNPLRLEDKLPAGSKYKDYMINDIFNLVECSMIYMLRGWWRSRGARLEWHIAKVLGLKIMYQKRKNKG